MALRKKLLRNIKAVLIECSPSSPGSVSARYSIKEFHFTKNRVLLNRMRTTQFMCDNVGALVKASFSKDKPEPRVTITFSNQQNAYNNLRGQQEFLLAHQRYDG